MARAQLCATVTAETTAELRRRRDEVVGADLVELRVDGVRNLDLEGALVERPRLSESPRVERVAVSNASSTSPRARKVSDSGRRIKVAHGF